MIIIQPMGGLGNILFILFNGYALSKDNNMKLLVNSEYMDKRKNITDYKMCNSFRLVNRKFMSILKNVQTYKEPNHYYNKININSVSVNYIWGYFQSYKYFEKYIPELKELLFNNMKNEVEELIIKNKEMKKDKTTIMIHIRRGDYVQLNDIHPTQTQDYYKKTLEDIEKKINNIKLVIFSDDIQFVKKWNIFDNYDKYFVSEEDPEKTLIMMSLCDNFIIANSSLSLMAYYLRENKEAICYAPQKWFGIKGPEYRIEDILEEKIIKVD
jgi:hypothetical protein